MERPLTPGCLCGAGRGAGQGGLLPSVGCGGPHSCHRGPVHSGCARACSHEAPSPTLPRGRTAFPAPGCHSSFPSCSKVPVKPLSRVWGVSPQPHSPRTPLWGTRVPPQSPRGMAQLCAAGQLEQAALVGRHGTRTGLLQWHSHLSLVPVTLPCWGGSSLPQQLWGLSPGCAGELRFTSWWRGLVVSRATRVSYYHQRDTHAARGTGRVTQVMMGATFWAPRRQITARSTGFGLALFNPMFLNVPRDATVPGNP